MSVQSMTGFARREGSADGMRYVWELRSVNGKNLDLRLRLPPGYDRLEGEIRKQAGELLTRGNLQVSLTVNVTATRLDAVLNQDAIRAVMALKAELGDLIDPAPLRFDTLLSIRGLVDFREAEDSEHLVAERDAAILAGLREAVADLAAMRRSEGEVLRRLLLAQVDDIERLTALVENDPSRSVEEIRKRIAGQIELLTGSHGGLDRDRLHAEAALLATRADLREELDRLKAHVAAARDLLSAGGAVGRKLDFLAQEFNRESNTICSKSNSAAVTSAGLELKAVIDQFREQIQNLE